MREVSGGLLLQDTGWHLKVGLPLCSCLACLLLFDILCRVQLPGVGPLEKLTIALNGGSEQAAWLVEQVEVTDEGTGGDRLAVCGSG